ncbi:HAD family hydrolase [Endozoicomonas sp.]|uniref:HAD family hydrolase n=1 Tax=Endozoicomonas sp. TaxID=1892382 RepID=UPI002888744E|nr:HAD family hydrolase [Endozoicomonas sp.]
MSKPLYVFDLDHTLIGSDCMMEWHKFLVEKGVVSDPNFLAEERHLMSLYGKGKLNMESYLAFSLTPLKSINKADIHALVSECVETRILTTHYLEARKLLTHLNQGNHQLLMISASVTFLVEPIGQRLGIQQSLGINLLEDSGCYTPVIQGIPSYREGKVTRLQEWLALQTGTFDEIHFYTDSINDLPLCQFADFSYLVNPCARLAKYKEHQNWTVLSWDAPVEML